MNQELTIITIILRKLNHEIHTNSFSRQTLCTLEDAQLSISNISKMHLKPTTKHKPVLKKYSFDSQQQHKQTNMLKKYPQTTVCILCVVIKIQNNI